MIRFITTTGKDIVQETREEVVQIAIQELSKLRNEQTDFLDDSPLYNLVSKSNITENIMLDKAISALKHLSTPNE